MTKVIKVSYYKGNNFGDELGPYIVSKLSGFHVEYKEIAISPLRLFFRIIKNVLLFNFRFIKHIKYISFDKRVLVPIGSSITRGNKNTSHWGTGYLNSKSVFKGGKVYAVRGKLTDERLRKEGFEGCSVYGDPALLLPIIYPIQKKHLYEIGIIPHYLDYSYFINQYSSQYKIIDVITNDVEKTISEIISCKKVLSSSLHGIIVAQAYNIPALWIKKNDIDTDDGFKFKDYFSSVAIAPYEGFTNIEEILKNENSINDFFKKNRDIEKIQVDLKEIQKSLLKVAPFPILEKYNNIDVL